LEQKATKETKNIHCLDAPTPFGARQTVRELCSGCETTFVVFAFDRMSQPFSTIGLTGQDARVVVEPIALFRAYYRRRFELWLPSSLPPLPSVPKLFPRSPLFHDCLGDAKQHRDLPRLQSPRCVTHRVRKNGSPDRVPGAHFFFFRFTSS
jgi:hypothetical protein